MSLGKFVGSPEELHARATEVNNYAQDLATEANKVFAAVEQLVTGEYLSPEARVIGNQIFEKRDEINNVCQVVADYGSYFNDAGNAITDNQNNIASSIRINN